jgi:3'-phosphoadenosine 5'-phosphosulfate sulfotransferase (PAPS reductase)/FAD synthetase
MKKYLSFGGGVNSVAMMLLLLDQGKNFDEAVFIDHETDWPETYEYLAMFQDWLEKNGHDKITVLKPEMKRKGKIWNNLYDFHFHKSLVPLVKFRSCTGDFKVRPYHKYVSKPCFSLIGFSYEEAHRAKISIEKGVEIRWPLIEQEITRDGCKDIIRNHGLPVPRKSGCFICPFQPRRQWIELRRIHPELFCKAMKLEEKNILYQIKKHPDRLPYTINGGKKKLFSYIEEDQMKIFEQDIFPPCSCGL